MGLTYECKAGSASARSIENLGAARAERKKGQPKEIHERAPVDFRDEVDDVSFLLWVN